MAAVPTLQFPCKLKNVIVEIGHGEAPIWHTFRKLPLEDQSYLGLDINASAWPQERKPIYNLDAGRTRIIGRAKLGYDCQFMLLDESGTLPVPDGQSSEAYLSLVLNDPRILLQTVERLLLETARIAKPGGYLVIDNGSTTSADAGDILVSPDSKKLVFKISPQKELTTEDITNPFSAFLNRAFLPMEASLYSEFMHVRGFPTHCNIEPGFSISILVRR
ncbi:MAG: hypothetical protein V1861_02145 [Candidatus Micrarchaeota archaeon]